MMDLHCHLDLYPNPREIAEEIVARNYYVLSVTTTPTAWEGTKSLAPNGSRIRTALGLHPQLVAERYSEIDLFEQLLPRATYVGEIGLDGGPEHRSSFERQQAIFRRVLVLCAREGGRILSIHSRRAAAAVLDELEAQRGAGTAILHWFTGTRKELFRAVELDCRFSVGPAMLRSTKGRQLIGNIPRHLLLLETDGPFAQLEGRPLLPWESALCVQDLAEIWGCDAPAVAHQLRTNLANMIE